MPAPITRTRKHRRSRQLSGQRRPLQNAIPIEVVTATPSGADVILQLNQPVALKGVPQFLKNGTVVPTGATLTSPTTLVMTYPPLSPAATTVLVPPEEPAVRSASGGFVTPKSVAA